MPRRQISTGPRRGRFERQCPEMVKAHDRKSSGIVREVGSLDEADEIGDKRMSEHPMIVAPTERRRRLPSRSYELE